MLHNCLSLHILDSIKQSTFSLVHTQRSLKLLTIRVIRMVLMNLHIQGMELRYKLGAIFYASTFLLSSSFQHGCSKELHVFDSE